MSYNQDYRLLHLLTFEEYSICSISRAAAVCIWRSREAEKISEMHTFDISDLKICPCNPTKLAGTDVFYEVVQQFHSSKLARTEIPNRLLLLHWLFHVLQWGGAILSNQLADRRETRTSVFCGEENWIIISILDFQLPLPTTNWNG